VGGFAFLWVILYPCLAPFVSIYIQLIFTTVRGRKGEGKGGEKNGEERQRLRHPYKFHIPLLYTPLKLNTVSKIIEQLLERERKRGKRGKRKGKRDIQVCRDYFR